ncbi:hypothetical protein BCR43DRAFT_486181 [Syncephalastrum racemosum]|uniref:C2H2-type domain-containing protein n=1 Tax=Syncephalastrum racemosum TaxID=13706 RepID=A0A1X2HNX5_SYNRA|nr:hypothetical protein BCR43DRAFT_486181 [Syncephalastrum racemosum]
MAPQRSRSASNSGTKPRLFQCTGYGDCHMVFTRSEHLARHARKHTGEKPFQCVVAGCNKMFSRFDNMMQHTQTHRTALPPLTTTTDSTSKRRRRQSSCSSTSSSESSDPVTPTACTSPIASGGCSSMNNKSSGKINTPTISSNGRRRLSIADLCNPTPSASAHTRISSVPSGVRLTKDELEALQAFNHLHSPTSDDFSKSLRDLAPYVIDASTSSPSPAVFGDTRCCSRTFL